MNSITLWKCGQLLQARTTGCRLHYVLTAKGFEDVYLLRLMDRAGTLLISTNRKCPALLHLAHGDAPGGEKSPAAERLEGKLAGRALESIVIPAIDRSARVEWSGGLTMRIDLLPRRPAIWIGDGAPVLPGSDKPDLLGLDPGQVDGEDTREWLGNARRAVRSAPPEWMAEVEERAGGVMSALPGAWRELADELRGDARPALYRIGGRPVVLPLRLQSAEPEASWDDLDVAMAAWWAIASDEILVGGEAGRLLATVRGEMKRLRRAATNLRRDLANAERTGEYRRLGEVLSIHFHTLKRGASSTTLPDPYEGGDLEIPLDPKKSPRENVDRYFKRASKGERAFPLVTERLAGIEAKLAALGKLEERATEVKSVEEVEALREEAKPYLPAPPKEPEWRKRIRSPRDKRQAAGNRPREYTVAGGYTVLVGRDNKENDFLTFKIAGQRDIWFHVSQSPGSHAVLLRDPKVDPPKEALLAAAAIAAYYSKARNASKVPVNYTERRFVRKPRGAPAGQVTISREKTLFVEPGLPEEQE